MRPKTVWIIGAILFVLVMNNEILTLLVLAALLLPGALRMLELASDAETGRYRDYND